MNARLLRVGIQAAVIATAIAGVTAGQAAAMTPPSALATTSNPIAGCTVESSRAANLFVNAEVEPWVAVNPTDHQNVLGAVQQDRWFGGGAHGLSALVSKDGGSSFDVVALPFSLCASGGLNYERASDPWVSFGPDGTAYAVGIAFDADSDNSGIVAATSSDGGATWTNAQSVVLDTTTFNDKVSVTADPTNAGTAYVTWDRVDACCQEGPVWLSKTTDFGVTWSAPQQLTEFSLKFGDQGSQILINKKTGVMYDFFARFYYNTGGVTYFMTRSADHGATWSRPKWVARDQSVADADPHSGGLPIRTGRQNPEVAIDNKSGRLYLVWEDARYTNGAYNQVVISTSANGSVWSPPRLVSTDTGYSAMTPAVAVNNKGQVAVTYYDMRTFDVNDAAVPTSYWMRISPARAKAFGEDIPLIDTPFDMTKAPFSVGLFLGDYQGLARSGSSFVPLYCVATTDVTNRTDCYASKVTP